MGKLGLSVDELVEIIQSDAQAIAAQYPTHPREDLILTLIAMAIAKNNEKIAEDLKK